MGYEISQIAEWLNRIQENAGVTFGQLKDLDSDQKDEPRSRLANEILEFLKKPDFSETQFLDSILNFERLTNVYDGTSSASEAGLPFELPSNWDMQKIAAKMREENPGYMHAIAQHFMTQIDPEAYVATLRENKSANEVAIALRRAVAYGESSGFELAQTIFNFANTEQPYINTNRTYIDVFLSSGEIAKFIANQDLAPRSLGQIEFLHKNGFDVSNAFVAAAVNGERDVTEFIHTNYPDKIREISQANHVGIRGISTEHIILAKQLAAEMSGTQASPTAMTRVRGRGLITQAESPLHTPGAETTIPLTTATSPVFNQPSQPSQPDIDTTTAKPASRKQLQEEIATLRNENSTMKERMTLLEEQMATDYQRIQQLEGVINELDSENAELSEELSNLKEATPPMLALPRTEQSEQPEVPVIEAPSDSNNREKLAALVQDLKITVDGTAKGEADALRGIENFLQDQLGNAYGKIGGDGIQDNDFLLSRNAYRVTNQVSKDITERLADGSISSTDVTEIAVTLRNTLKDGAIIEDTPAPNEDKGYDENRRLERYQDLEAVDQALRK